MGDADFGDLLNEFFADDDSDIEFEGFDLNDLDEEIVANEVSEINEENWQDGDRPAPNSSFTGLPGIQKDIIDPDSPIDYFEIYVTDDDIQDMVHQTNLYAAQQLQQKQLKENSRFKKWVDTTINEMPRFLAMLIAMTLVVQLDISEYWTTNPVTATPFFGECMPRDRFYLLLSFFHLKDNSFEENIPQDN